jgi:hypothetical protein
MASSKVDPLSSYTADGCEPGFPVAQTERESQTMLTMPCARSGDSANYATALAPAVDFVHLGAGRAYSQPTITLAK